MPKERNLRKKRALEEDEDEQVVEEESLREKLEATRNLQKQRQRSQGLAADNLAGAPMQSGAAGLAAEGDNAFMGGYIREAVKVAKDESDPDLEKYVQQQLQKRLGRGQPEEEEAQPSTHQGDDIYAIPKALRAQKADQEDVSAWMTGIVEVPLSVAHKLKSIEETEAAKKRLLEQSRAAPFGIDDEDETAEGEAPAQLRRVAYPLKFGKQSEKERERERERGGREGGKQSPHIERKRRRPMS